MVTELQPALDRSLGRRFATVSDDARLRRTAAALEANGISVLRAADAADARRIVLGLIPDGSQVHHGASQSLEAAGITAELETSGRYEPLRPRVWSMDRATQADEIRRLTAAPDVMLGSVHAVTETESLVTASASGRQLGPYAAGAGRVIFVVGAQKIVPDLAEGLRRIEEYVFPLEDARAQAAYGMRSGINKLLIVNREFTPGRTTVVLVDEPSGSSRAKGSNAPCPRRSRPRSARSSTSRTPMSAR
jgi:LUD domain